jgi:putative tryptophan/tyrosine transport system substrate-binding protein
VNRRAFFTGLAAVLAAPLGGEAQQAGKIYRIGFLTSSLGAVGEFKKGMADLGHRDGQTFAVEVRNIEGDFERLPAAVASLVKLPVDLFVVGGSEYVQAIKDATRTIPVVFSRVGDPLEQGFVASYAKPGGNITGVTSMMPDLMGKQLELLTQAHPGIKRIAALWNPQQPAHPGMLKALESAGRSLRLQVNPVAVRTSQDLDGAFSTIRRERMDGLVVLISPLHYTSIRDIAGFTVDARLPGICWLVDFPKVGGLMSYGANEAALYRQAATFVDRIMKGANPANLPVEQPKKFELVINLKTAKALGLTIPPSLLLRADQVIE